MWEIKQQKLNIKKEIKDLEREIKEIIDDIWEEAYLGGENAFDKQ